MPTPAASDSFRDLEVLQDRLVLMLAAARKKLAEARTFVRDADRHAKICSADAARATASCLKIQATVSPGRLLG